MVFPHDRKDRLPNPIDLPNRARSGQLRAIGDANLRGRFESASTRRDLEILADEFQAAVEQGVHDKLGWPSSMYGEIQTPE